MLWAHSCSFVGAWWSPAELRSFLTLQEGDSEELSSSGGCDCVNLKRSVSCKYRSIRCLHAGPSFAFVSSFESSYTDFTMFSRCAWDIFPKFLTQLMVLFALPALPQLQIIVVGVRYLAIQNAAIFCAVAVVVLMPSWFYLFAISSFSRHLLLKSTRNCCELRDDYPLSEMLRFASGECMLWRHVWQRRNFVTTRSRSNWNTAIDRNTCVEWFTKTWNRKLRVF